MFKPQKTKFQLLVIDNFDSLSQWAVNPWRRYSLALTVILTGYFFGSSLGMISAVVELIDPVGAFLSVSFIEIFIIVAVTYFMRGCGEIGRRTRFRFWRLRACRFKSYHPHHNHDLIWPKALIYKHLMMFMQLGVKQNDNSTLCIFGNWFLSSSYSKNICYQGKPTI